MINESENHVKNGIKIPGLFLLITALLLIFTSCSCSTSDNPPLKVAPTETPAISFTATPEKTSTKTETVPIVDSSQKKSGRSFFWVISSNTTDIFILGSIHVARPDIYPLDSTIEDAFEIADNLVVEVDINEVDAGDSMSLLFEYGLYTEGETLKKNLPVDLYTALDEFFKEHGLNISLFNNYRPWVIATLIDQLVTQELGYAAEYGIDYYFLEKASESGKNIIELESAEFQLKMMSSFPDELMILYLQKNLENLPEQEDMESLFEAWQTGDVLQMLFLTYGAVISEPELEPFYEVLLSQRNLTMAEKIGELLAGDEEYFVVVGAGHLIGEGGIIDLLSDWGYDTEQLN